MDTHYISDLQTGKWNASNELHLKAQKGEMVLN